MRLLNLAIPAAVGALILPACGDGSTKAPEGDIAITACTPDPAGGKPKAEGTIVNNTTKPSGYTFRVRFLDPAGNEVTQATNGVARVEAGATATWKAEGAASARGPLTCGVANATRTAVGG